LDPGGPPAAAPGEPDDPDDPDEPDEPDKPPESEDAPSDFPAAVEAAESEAAPLVSLESPVEAFDFDALAVDRSFLAQPEPLKWTEGATIAFRSVSSAPQAGQNRGCGASIPWMNSVRVEQLEQT
jgi:hypothetical protein